MTTFQNRHPLNLTNAKEIAYWRAEQDFGHHIARAEQGKKGIHVYTSYNSGLRYGIHDPETTRIYIGFFPDRQTLIAYLLQEPPKISREITNKFLEDLEYEGAAA